MSQPGRSRLWLIGGTRESAELARAIANRQLPCLITVTTPAAQSLYPDSAFLEVRVGRLREATIGSFLQQAQVSHILDASHPFASAISALAIAAAERWQLPYLRYQRPELAPPQSPQVVLTSLESLLSSDLLSQQRVLLTLGYRWLHQFQPWHGQTQLYARILPSPEALAAAIAAGFTAKTLIALRPPLSLELEKALWQQWQITTVVTKASGKAGGEDIKRQLAEQLRVRLILIERPAVNYPQQTSNIAIALRFCQNPTPHI